MTSYFPAVHLREASFTASDAWRITDVNPPVQRDWRTRGLLPKVEGWARFTPNELIHVALRDAMRQLGMPHTNSEVDLSEAAIQAQAWAATHPESIRYSIGIDSVRYPLSALRPPTQFRYAGALAPWQDITPLQFALDFEDLQGVLTADDYDRSGIALIDLKAVGLRIAERAGEPLWYVSAGPGPNDINSALNAASSGDKAAQKALEAIGQEWDSSKL